MTHVPHLSNAVDGGVFVEHAPDDLRQTLVGLLPAGRASSPGSILGARGDHHHVIPEDAADQLDSGLPLARIDESDDYLEFAVELCCCARRPGRPEVPRGALHFTVRSPVLDLIDLLRLVVDR